MTTLDTEYVTEVCQPGTVDCCRYLGASAEGFGCLKHTKLAQQLDDRVAAGTIRAVGDNCPGYDQTLFIVRFYDGFDNLWMDITKEVSRAEAVGIWREKTENGTIKSKFEDIDYYRIFPADTRMIYS